MPLTYMDGHFCLYDSINDWSYVMDDYGNAVYVNWGLYSAYWQDSDMT